MSVLVESALLGHGLLSVSDTELLARWPSNDVNIAWIEDNEIMIGNIHKFIQFREMSHCWARADGLTIKDKVFQTNSFLTASGTMMVAEQFGFKIVVSAGIGGIGDIINEPFCYDLIALSLSNIVLIATGPKDMLDHQATFDWLKDHQVKTFGNNSSIFDGYIFEVDSYPLDYRLQDSMVTLKQSNHRLILNPIDRSNRIQNIKLLNQGIQKGKEAEFKNEYYHPAVNAYFDEVTNGQSSLIQLSSLISNIHLAEDISTHL